MRFARCQKKRGIDRDPETDTNRLQDNARSAINRQPTTRAAQLTNARSAT
jgi:hypothetical protein